MYKKSCMECKSEFITKDHRMKFCSRSCSAASRNKKVLTKEKIKKICIQCGKPYPVKGCRSNESKFCSKKCKSNNWINHGEYLYHDQAIKLLGNKCFHCGSDKDIVVHHKDGNHINNDPNNWKIVCRKCHNNIEHKDSIAKILNASHRNIAMKE